ncbi:MAG: hypothetical protein AAGF90_09685, partial [Pseudomonadota bacterium]
SREAFSPASRSLVSLPALIPNAPVAGVGFVGKRRLGEDVVLPSAPRERDDAAKPTAVKEIARYIRHHMSARQRLHGVAAAPNSTTRLFEEGLDKRMSCRRRQELVLGMEVHLRCGEPEGEGVRIQRRERLRRFRAGVSVCVDIESPARGEEAEPKQIGADGGMGGFVEDFAGGVLLLQKRSRRPIVEPPIRTAHPSPSRHQSFDVVGRARRIPELDDRSGGRAFDDLRRRLRPQLQKHGPASRAHPLEGAMPVVSAQIVESRDGRAETRSVDQSERVKDVFSERRLGGSERRKRVEAADLRSLQQLVHRRPERRPDQRIAGPAPIGWKIFVKPGADARANDLAARAARCMRGQFRRDREPYGVA